MITEEMDACRGHGMRRPVEYLILRSHDLDRLVRRVRALLRFAAAIGAEVRRASDVAAGDEADDLALLAVHINDLGLIIARDLAWIDAGGDP